MLAYIWPIGLVVVANVFYQICTKSVPGEMNPLASLTITYLVGAAASTILYFALNPGGNIATELSRTNWAPFVLGIAIVGLEVGYIYAYKIGWSVSVAPLVQAAALSVVMLFVGYFLYREGISVSKIAGILLCLTGMYFISR